MFVHSVYFWLKEDLSDADRATFDKGVRALLDISSVKQGFVGAPASTDRPIIDRSYTTALIVMFENEAGQDHYQVDPIHDKFRDECASFWTKVVIYDAEN